MDIQSRSQKYAAAVYDQVVDMNNMPVDATFKDQYKSTVENLPVLIRTAGLVQALEFVNTRDKKDKKVEESPYKTLLKHIAKTVKEEDLLATSRTADLNAYMHLTQKVLDALVWYKRFVSSVLNEA